MNTDTQNTARAIAILRAGRSYDEAATSTGLSVKAVMKAWEVSSQSTAQSTGPNHNRQAPFQAPQT